MSKETNCLPVLTDEDAREVADMLCEDGLSEEYVDLVLDATAAICEAFLECSDDWSLIAERLESARDRMTLWLAMDIVINGIEKRKARRIAPIIFDFACRYARRMAARPADKTASTQEEEIEISFALRAKGREDGVESLLSLMRDSGSVGIGEPRVLPEGGVELYGDCLLPTLAEGMNALCDGLDFPGLAKHLGLDIEMFSTGMRYDRTTCEYFCEHLHASAAGELLACDEADVDGIFDWNPSEESFEDVLWDWGLVPDDDTRRVPSNYIVIAGCPIDMYEWSEALS
jgi:hypothetical protein